MDAVSASSLPAGLPIGMETTQQVFHLCSIRGQRPFGQFNQRTDFYALDQRQPGNAAPVGAGLKGQKPAEGYNIQQMLEILTAQDVPVKLCKTCTDASAGF
jgi:hypothetical protein